MRPLAPLLLRRPAATLPEVGPARSGRGGAWSGRRGGEGPRRGGADLQAARRREGRRRRRAAELEAPASAAELEVPERARAEPAMAAEGERRPAAAI